MHKYSKLGHFSKQEMSSCLPCGEFRIVYSFQPANEIINAYVINANVFRDSKSKESFTTLLPWPSEGLIKNLSYYLLICRTQNLKEIRWQEQVSHLVLKSPPYSAGFLGRVT